MKNEKFMREFIELYLDKRSLEYPSSEVKLKNKKKLEVIDKKIESMLPKYPLLFEGDITILYGVFQKTLKDRNEFTFGKTFNLFVGWVFDELYDKKIIDKKTYEKLNSFLTKFDLEPSTSGAIIGKGI
jgi:hypothetical protein